MTIRQKLILLLLVVGLLPALLLSSVAYITISRSITDRTVDQLDSIAGKQADKVSQLLNDMQFEATRGNNDFTINDAVGRYLSAKQKLAQIQIVAGLKTFVAGFRDIDSILLVDQSGKVFGATSQDLLDKQLANEEYATPADGGSITVLKRDPTDNIDKLYIISPFTFGPDRIGTAITKFNLNAFVAVVQDYSGLGSSGETVIGLRGSDDNVTSLFALRFDVNAAFERHLNTLSLAEQSATVFKNVPDYRNHQVIAATRYIPITGWGLATKIDRSEALAPITVLRNTVIAIFVSTVAALALLALLLARRVTAPLLAITTKAREISAGNLRQRLPLTSRDEIGTLAAAFNTMTDRLAESYGALEQKVEERTMALNQKVEELGQAKAKDDAILDSIGDGLLVTDSGGYVLLINDVATDLLKVDKNSVYGKKLETLYTLYDEANQPIASENRPVRVALKQGKKISQEVTVMDSDNHKIALGVTATPVIQHDQIIGSIEIIRDITKEKEVDRMKTEFISLASHQLRTPLSAIKWFSEMLLSGDAGKLNDDQTEFAQNVVDSTARMIDLVNSLLNISRIESGRIMIDPKPTDLSQLVHGIVNDLKAKIEERQQTLVVSVHKELPKVNLDARLIGQVYLNLLTNGIKYTPKGGEISVFVSRKGEELVSQVSDNGYGIPKAEQAKMFQKFFRATNVSKIETDGTGLGMYLIKAIIESSGGKIWFESEEGKGTTFWFSLPMSGMKAKQGEVTIDS
jgi:signal transduction histidine kinase